MVTVVSQTGKPLMPTTEYKARRLLKKGRAEIFCRHPFTIRLLDRDESEACDWDHPFMILDDCGKNVMSKCVLPD